MAKVDCTELEQAISDLAMALGAQEGIETLDDVVAEIQKSFPVMPREEIVNALVSANTTKAREINELSAKLAEIKNQARRESEPRRRAQLEKQIAEYERRIAEGDLERPRLPEIPQSKELERLAFERDQLRRDIRLAIIAARPRALFSKVIEPFNIVRDILTTGEFSFILRQGGAFAYGHPVKTAQIVAETMQGFTSELNATREHNRMMADPMMTVFIRAGGHLSPIGPNAELTRREEFALSTLFYKVPGLKAFTRTGALFCNKLRFEMFKILNGCVAIDRDMTQGEAQVAAKAVNEGTGRAFEGGGKIGALSSMMFSANWFASRAQTMMGHPMWSHWSENAPEMRMAVAKHLYLRPLIGLAMIYLLGKMAGGEEEWDPRSSDFGKIRFGRVRLDPMLGFSQIIVFGTRVSLSVLSNFFPEIRETKSTKTGKAMKLTDVEYGQRDITDVIASFERGKAHPGISMTWNLAAHEDVIGNPTSVAREIVNVHPITWGDIVDVAQEDMNETGEVALSVLGYLGMGLQVYEERSKKKLKWYEWK